MCGRGAGVSCEVLPPTCGSHAIHLAAKDTPVDAAEQAGASAKVECTPAILVLLSRHSKSIGIVSDTAQQVFHNRHRGAAHERPLSTACIVAIAVCSSYRGLARSDMAP